MKNSNDNIGNRTRDLPACSGVPQPTAPPRASVWANISMTCAYCNLGCSSAVSHFRTSHTETTCQIFGIKIITLTPFIWMKLIMCIVSQKLVSNMIPTKCSLQQLLKDVRFKYSYNRTSHNRDECTSRNAISTCLGYKRIVFCASPSSTLPVATILTSWGALIPWVVSPPCR
jgi:hypothetical protein